MSPDLIDYEREENMFQYIILYVEVNEKNKISNVNNIVLFIINDATINKMYKRD